VCGFDGIRYVSELGGILYTSVLVLEEAIGENANLIISYHPPLFEAMKRSGTSLGACNNSRCFIQVDHGRREAKDRPEVFSHHSYPFSQSESDALKRELLYFLLIHLGMS